MCGHDTVTCCATLSLSLIGTLTLLSLLLYYVFPSGSKYIIINARSRLDFFGTKARQHYVANAKTLIESGLAKSNIFQLEGDSGIQLILSPKYANEIRSHPFLSFTKALTTEFHANLKGYDPILQIALSSEIFQTATRTNMTRALGRITKPLSNETTAALQDIWTDSTEWHTTTPKHTLRKIMSQTSSKIFLGPDLSRNKTWVHVTTDYTTNLIKANEALRKWPYHLRSLVSYFLPITRQLRTDLSQARALVLPVLEERRRSQETAVREGRVPERYDDAMQWIEECANGRPYDPAGMQLALIFVAIAGATDLITQAVLNLCQMGDVMAALREEVILVLGDGGLTHGSLFKLQLMDSFLKECQRMKPLEIVTMRRVATDDVYLKDGHKIDKGTQLAVSNSWMWNSKFYEDPETFDAYRFVKLRQVSGREASANLVSVSLEHMAFGLGGHSCTGRFFAANHIKIVLCHILLKYEFRLADGSVPVPRRYGLRNQADPTAKIVLRRRRRQEEIFLGDLAH